jgi:cytochrome P450
MTEAPDVHDIAWPPELGPYDPHSHAIQANPFPHYAFMREKAPVVKVRTAQGDFWFVSRFHDVQKSLRDAKRLSNAVINPDKFRSIVLMDAPRHSHLRSLVSPAFAPKAVAAFEEQLRSIFKENFVPILKRGHGDICKEFTERMALGAIVSFLGLPMGDFEHLRDLSTRLHSYIGRVARHAPGSEGDEEGFLAVLDLLRDALGDARKNPKNTIVAKFAEQIDAGLLTEEDFLHF